VENNSLIMGFIKILMIGMVLLFLAGCNPQKSDDFNEIKNLDNFKSKEFGFSFSFPSSWNEVARDLPERWAIINNEDTILFTVNKAQIKNLAAMGKIQALRDLYPETSDNKIEQEKIDEVNSMVKLASFNNKTWYTYAIKFPDKNVNSIVSGTLCGDNKINLVMVSSFDTFDENEIAYSSMLNSFEC
ncbi:hypothetical protein KKF17_00225, partial [Patescibacteria group bacterium]|nr:hypothetical protein [Patescibacteria group bacterium]